MNDDDAANPGPLFLMEKTRLVHKLRGARDRASKALGHRVEGRRGYAETNPGLVREAKRLYLRDLSNVRLGS